jgi:hypothetical protein
MGLPSPKSHAIFSVFSIKAEKVIPSFVKKTFGSLCDITPSEVMLISEHGEPLPNLNPNNMTDSRTVQRRTIHIL